MNLEEFNKKSCIEQEYPFRPIIICNDGLKISVQGSSVHYCTPRSDSYYYNEMEIGFPSEEIKELIGYAENKSDLLNTVYPYVPCDLIQKIIDTHGGINVELTFQ